MRVVLVQTSVLLPTSLSHVTVYFEFLLIVDESMTQVFVTSISIISVRKTISLVNLGFMQVTCLSCLPL